MFEIIIGAVISGAIGAYTTEVIRNWLILKEDSKSVIDEINKANEKQVISHWKEYFKNNSNDSVVNFIKYLIENIYLNIEESENIDKSGKALSALWEISSMQKIKQLIGLSSIEYIDLSKRRTAIQNLMTNVKKADSGPSLQKALDELREFIRWQLEQDILTPRIIGFYQNVINGE